MQRNVIEYLYVSIIGARLHRAFKNMVQCHRNTKLIQDDYVVDAISHMKIKYNNCKIESAYEHLTEFSNREIRFCALHLTN